MHMVGEGAGCVMGCGGGHGSGRAYQEDYKSTGEETIVNLALI